MKILKQKIILLVQMILKTSIDFKDFDKKEEAKKDIPF